MINTAEVILWGTRIGILHQYFELAGVREDTCEELVSYIRHLSS